jgi:hypothetical protein
VRRSCRYRGNSGRSTTTSDGNVSNPYKVKTRLPVRGPQTTVGIKVIIYGIDPKIVSGIELLVILSAPVERLGVDL